jgi:hypothetical protein
LHPSALAATTWDVCRLLGPKSQLADYDERFAPSRERFS